MVSEKHAAKAGTSHIDIPVKYVGLGEKETDMIPFDIEKYIYGLFKEF